MLIIMLGICACVVMLVFAWKMHVRVQNEQAEQQIEHIFKHSSSMELKGTFSNYQIENVDTRQKTIGLQMNEHMSDQLKSNINAYIDDNVSVLNRMFGNPAKDEDGQGNLLITGDQVEPICDAISYNKGFIKDYGKGWTIDIYNAQGDLVYIYSDDKFLDKPEAHLDKVIAEGQAAHDENATKLTEAVINAVGRNK